MRAVLKTTLIIIGIILLLLIVGWLAMTYFLQIFKRGSMKPVMHGWDGDLYYIEGYLVLNGKTQSKRTNAIESQTDDFICYPTL